MTYEVLIEKRTTLLLSLAVLAGIGAVAYADFVVTKISLAYLYILPLALSALVHRLRTSLGLALFCVVLHDAFGPFEHHGVPNLSANLLTLVGFITVVLFVNQLSKKRRELNELVKRQRDELTAEIKLAAEVQKRLLPTQPPLLKNFDIDGCMYPARAVGGDYFDFIELPAGNLGLAIADVSGKGVAAALLMATVETALRMDAPSSSHSDEIVRNLNRLLYQMTEEERYVTMCYGKLDAQRRRLEYTNAGHLPPLLLRAGGNEPLWLEDGGAVIGLILDIPYESSTVELYPGDLIVFYTDGVTEATNLKGEEYSRRRLLSLLNARKEKSAAQIVADIYADVVQFQNTSALRDDLTLIVLKVLPDAA